MSGDLRAPAVAGRFYPGDGPTLEEEVAGFVGETAQARPRIGILAPHAGYVYSGGVAGKVYAATEVPRRVVVLAPNHTGRGARGAVWARGSFALPGGAVPVDEELAARLIGRAGLTEDRAAHLAEHALEVQLPFLRARNRAVTITPIVLGPLDHPGCAAVADALREAAEALGEPLLVVASSDMNHYLPDDETRTRDQRALAPLLARDGRALHDVVLREDHSMCGFVPATVMIEYAVARGATAAELVAYATSGDAFGERDRVVGYAGVTVS
jgi:AmmeMemoRadiSam system protein B